MNRFSKIAVSAGTVFTILTFTPAVFAQTAQVDIHATNPNRVAHVNQVQVVSISASTITVFQNGKVYTINTGNYTDFRRRFWGRTTIAQISVGDFLNIWGRWIDSNHTMLNAYVIRDTSIQEAHDTFYGFVISVNPNGFLLQSEHRGQQTITVNTDTRFVDRNGNTIAQSDIAAQDHVVVDGLWDRASSIVGPADTVKDLTLPR